jgi:hypothetical protein
MEHLIALTEEELISYEGGGRISDAVWNFLSYLVNTDTASQMYNAPYVVSK